MKSVLFILLLGIANLGIAQTVAEVFAEAETALENGEYKTALKKVTYVLENDVPKVEYFQVKALAEIYLQKYQEAYETYTIGIDALPKASGLYNSRGNFLYEIQKFNAAIIDYTNAINLAETDSLNGVYHGNRSAPKMSMRDFEGAYDDLMVSYNIDTTSLVALTNLGVVCDETGRGDETLKYLLKAVAIDPSYFGAYTNIGFKYQLMGEHEKAIEYFDKALAYESEEPYSYSNRSYSKLQIGDTKGAMKDINKSIKLYPVNPYAYRNRALIYIEMGKMDKACEDLNEAIERGFTGMYGNEVKELLEKHCQ